MPQLIAQKKSTDSRMAFTQVKYVICALVWSNLDLGYDFGRVLALDLRSEH